MRKSSIFIIMVLLTPLVLALLVSASIEFNKTIYVLKTTYLLENTDNKTVTISFDENNIKEFLIPDIEGWQALRNYTVYFNGVDITKKCSLKSYKGNKIIVIPSYTLKPKEKVNITTVQMIEVYWAESGLTISRCSRSSALLENVRSISINSSALTYLGGFWTKHDNLTTWSKIIELKESIDADSDSLAEYVFKVSKWVAENIAYNPGNFVINYPAKILSDRKGVCGDKSALIVTLLRLKGIPSLIYFSIVYEENLFSKESSKYLNIEYRNFALHAFAVVCADETYVPIDTTVYADVGKCPYIDGAGVNISDKIIVFAQASDSDPNEVLTFSLPSTELKANIYKTIEKKNNPREKLLLPIIVVVVFACITWLFARNIAE